MNVMACRVFRDTKFGNQWVDPTISIPSIPVQEPDANSPAPMDPVLFWQLTISVAGALLQTVN